MRRRTLRTASARSTKLAVERMEGRVLLATFTVTNTNDDANMGSLRWAIGQSNATPGGNTIHFNIATSGVQTIGILSALPAITVPVTIDGTSEGGYTGTPLIELDGAGAGVLGVDGLDITAGDSTVEGLTIDRFSGDGISLSVAGNDAIAKDFIGTDPTGEIGEGQGGEGVYVQVNSDNNTISGNLISGNDQNGINLNGQSTNMVNSATSGNLIVGNLIGCDLTGTVAIMNRLAGVRIINAPMTTIGGTTAADRNILSSNGDGIALFYESDGTIVEGNYLGTDVTGSKRLVNTTSFNLDENGDLELDGVANVTIGGTAQGAGNLISAAGGTGGISSGVAIPPVPAENILIEGNKIGTDVTGTKALGNAGDGIIIGNFSNVTIGGTVVGAGNVISANSNDGINLGGIDSGRLVEGNFIGTDVTGTKALGNGGSGVYAMAVGATIGGLAAGQGNIIANNGFTAPFDRDGVEVVDYPATILSNSIDNSNGVGISLSFSIVQPAPVLTAAVSSGGTSTISGSLSANDGDYTLQFFANPGLDPAGHAEGETLIGTATVTVAGGAASFALTLPSGFAPGSYITATDTTAADATSQFSAGIIGTGAANEVGPPTISAATSSPTVLAGSDATDTFTISNPNPGPDQGVVFSDVIPAGTTFVSGVTSTGAPVVVTNGVANAAIGTLAAGGSVTVSIVLATSIATIPSFTNTAQVLSVTPPVFAGTITASVTTDVVPSADLSVAVTGPSGATSVGQDLTYVVTVADDGPSDSTGVILADALPAGVTLVSATASSGPQPTDANGVLTDDYGDLKAGASFTLTIVVTAGNGSVPTATDTASVVGNEADPDLTNNTASFAATVTALADISVDVVPSATSIGVGGTLIYHVTVTNAGPSPATDVMFTDSLPTSATFVSATASPGSTPIESGGVVTDLIGMIPAGGSVSLTITIIPTDAAPPMFSNTARAIATEPDPNLNNNSSTTTTTVFPVADLAITSETVTPGAVAAGNMATFTITVVNNGPSLADGVIVTDALPAGLTFLMGTAAAGTLSEVGGVVSAPVGTLLAGGTSVVTIVVLAAAAGTFTDGSTVSSPVADSNPSNNTADASLVVTPVADVSVALGGTAGPVYTGSTVTYTAVVTNAGPSPATNVMFADPLFAGASFVGVEANQVAGSVVDGVVELPLGTIPAGASVTVVLTVILTAPGTFTDTASVSATEPDPDPANNTSSASTTAITPQSIIAFSSANYAVPENAGSIAITLVRSSYSGDDVTVRFSTFGGNATPGVDYVATSETVDFPPGVTQATVIVPVLENPYDNHDEIVGLEVDSPTGSGVLATNPTTATLTIIDIDPNLVGPTVTSLKLSGYVSSITSIEVDTTGGLDPATATNPANYSIVAYGGGGKQGLPFGTIVPVATATYDAATGAITITPSRPLPGNELFLVDVHGSGPGAVSDLAGNPLNSIHGSKPGGDYLLSVARGTDIVYPNENGDPVTLKLTGPGTIDIDRYVAGDLEILQVVGGVANKTVVTGTVHPTLQRSKIATILGLGQFGSIRLKMTTPPFYVDNTVYPNLETQFDAPAIDTLLPTPPVTVTPKVKPRKVVTNSKHPHAATAHAAKAKVHAAKVHAAEAHKPPARHHR